VGNNWDDYGPLFLLGTSKDATPGEKEFSRRALNFYTGRDDGMIDFEEDFEAFVRLLGDSNFQFGIFSAVDAMSKAGFRSVRQYMYTFDAGFESGGVDHGDDMLTLFKPVGEYNLEDDEAAVQVKFSYSIKKDVVIEYST